MVDLQRPTRILSANQQDHRCSNETSCSPHANRQRRLSYAYRSAFSNKVDWCYDALIEDLDKAYGKKISKMACRVRFGTVSQHEGQDIDEFIAELRHASMDCDFSDQLDNRLKDQFVIGLRSNHIKKKLLEDEDRDLADIL